MPIPASMRPSPRRALVTFTVATRKSPLALAQAELAVAHLQERLAHHAFRTLKLTTTGDRQEEWSLGQEGGKGLFTGELESALRDFRADLAVHSAKDLPTESDAGLAIAGYLPREDARDVLVIREGLARPGSIATGSPRRRLQLQRQFVKAAFVEIRGNIDTRLRKVSEGLADATVLAGAGLRRLHIQEWPGLRFQILPLAVCVPAVGQGAIAIQARAETAAALRPNFDPVTWVQVELERAFLRAMGGGCHTAFAVHYDGTAVHVFHDLCGYQRFGLPMLEAAEPERVAARLIAQLELDA
jgi:hydroxymethylbilane synthase